MGIRSDVALAKDNDKAEQDVEAVLESVEGTSFESAMAALELPLELTDNFILPSMAARIH